jgi:hypothetical protein
MCGTDNAFVSEIRVNLLTNLKVCVKASCHKSGLINFELVRNIKVFFVEGHTCLKYRSCNTFSGYWFCDSIMFDFKLGTVYQQVYSYILHYFLVNYNY